VHYRVQTRDRDKAGHSEQAAERMRNCDLIRPEVRKEMIVTEDKAKHQARMKWMTLKA
jgi:hypothetical protein